MKQRGFNSSPPPRRILMTADTVGGVWTYALELVAALRPFDISVGLATMGGPLNASQAHEAAQLSNLHLFESRYKLEWMEDPWHDVTEAGCWLLDLATHFQPDLVHLNGYCHGALDWNCPRLIVAHSCVYSWWHAVLQEPPPPKWRQYNRKVRAGLQAADLLVAPTQAMLNEVQRFYGVLPPAIVIPNGRQPEPFHPRAKKEVILSAGRLWDPAKNLAALDQVARGLPWRVYVAGDAQPPEGHSTPFGHVNALGRLSQTELQGWYARAAIYALPALYEPFGLSILEAALSECALVLGDIPSLQENWLSAARFVPPRDPEALQRALAELIADPPQRQRLAIRARSRAQEFTPERLATQYLAAYEYIRQQSGRTSSREIMACAS